MLYNWLNRSWQSRGGRAYRPPAQASPVDESARISKPEVSMRKGKNYTRNTASRCVTARVMRAGVMHARNFGLATYKTFPAAEKAAAAWVKKLKASLPDPIPEKGRMT